jgi:DNA polymerase III epsilon subunit-like protein
LNAFETKSVNNLATGNDKKDKLLRNKEALGKSSNDTVEDHKMQVDSDDASEDAEYYTESEGDSDIICDDDSAEPTLKKSIIIKPEGFTILNSHIHGITHDYASSEGINIEEALDILYADFKSAEFVVAHNANFDVNILLSECFRHDKIDLYDMINKLNIICTMKTGKAHMHYYKYPKLVELYE